MMFKYLATEVRSYESVVEVSLSLLSFDALRSFVRLISLPCLFSSSPTLPQAGEVFCLSDSPSSTIPTPSKVTSSSSSTVFSNTRFVRRLFPFIILLLWLTSHPSPLFQIGRSFLLSLNAFHRLAYRRLSEQRLVGIASERDPQVRRALAEARRNGEFQRSEEEEETSSSPVVLNGLGVEGLNLGPM